MDGWGFTTQLTIDIDEISSVGPVVTLPDFTFKFTHESVEADVRESIFAKAKSTGADLRVSSDSSGNNLLKVDVIHFDPSSQEFQISAGTLSIGTTGFDIALYLWWGNASAPAQTGSEAYDSGLIQYLPLEGDANDRTANSNNATLSSLAFPTDEIAGAIGTGLNLDGSGGGNPATGDCIILGTDLVSGFTSLAFSMWVNLTDTNKTHTILSDRNTASDLTINLRYDQPNRRFNFDFYTLTSGLTNQTYTPASNPEGAWRHLVFSWSDGGAPTMYLDGTQIGGSGTSTGATMNPTRNLLVGGSPHFQPFGGEFGVDEIQIHSTARNRAYWITEGNMISRPGDFATSGGVVSLLAASDPRRARSRRDRIRR